MKKVFTILILTIAIFVSNTNESFAISSNYKFQAFDSINNVMRMHPTSIITFPFLLNSINVVKEFTVSASAYTANCNGCSGITETGINLKRNPNSKIIAVDPDIIKLGTTVYVEGYGYAIAGDLGSTIKGNKIEVFIPTKSDAFKWGHKNVKIIIFE